MPTLSDSATTAHRAAAGRLLEAAATGVPCPPVRTLFDGASVDDAYAVQSLVHAVSGAGRRRLGCKIGLTSEAVQQQMGVDRPDFGVLYADMAFGDNEPVPSARLLQPRIEAEVAFVLGEDLPQREVTAVDVLRATEFVLPAIEIVDSRIADWDITIVDTVADNASSGLFVLGGPPRRLLDIDDLGTIRMGVTLDGEVVSRGTGAACLGHPVNAVVWLANELAARGEPIRAGDLVLSGALGPLVTARAGCRYEATLEGLGSVRAVFDAG
jgi:2-keto-4-pentenoate hydratase